MLGGIVAMVLAAGLVGWLVVRGDGGDRAGTPATEDAPTTEGSTSVALGPVALTRSGLRTLVGSFDQPVYWLGPRTGYRYELVRRANGNVFLRYLPPGAAAGDSRALRTVGTYPFADAYAATRRLGDENDAVWKELPGGWLAVYRRSRPTNIYLARRSFDYQLEVYDPSPTIARQLVTSGKLDPVS